MKLHFDPNLDYQLPKSARKNSRVRQKPHVV